MLASKMATALRVLANRKLVPLAPVSPVNLFTSVKWEQLLLYMYQFHVMGGWLGSS